MARPGVLCKLKKGKIIGVQNGFVDTFNWLVDTIDGLTKNAKIKDVDVVVGNDYDTATHKFRVHTKKMRVLVISDIVKKDDVFEAVPLEE